MGKLRRGQPYGLLAKYYDKVFESERRWGVVGRQRLLGKLLPRIDSACDLACGTGTTAMEFARRGLRVYGVDLSAEMCAQTRKKARREGLKVRVIEADMRDFRLPERVDLVTCEFDAINHVPKKSDLALVARSVALALRPGGTFVFDANNRLSFERLWPGTWWIEKPGVIMVMHGGYRKKQREAYTDVEWFVRAGKMWRRFTEHVEEVCWTEPEVRAALGGAGFEDVRRWDAAPFFKGNPVVQPGYRTYWVAKLRKK